MVACSLDLILGYGGMVSFGHAAFVGVGAYTVAILGHHGVTSGLIAWPVSVAMAALLALVIGGISLRTSGVYFIMITLAFAQMLYYLTVSLKTYGGDDGVRIVRNTFAGVLDCVDPRPCTMSYGSACAWCSGWGDGSCTRALAWCCAVLKRTNSACKP